MTTPTILAALNTFQQAANRGTAVHLSPELVQELRDALKAEPEGDDGDDVIDRWIESRPGWPDDWPGVTQSQLTALIGEALERWGRIAAPPAPEPFAWIHRQGRHYEVSERVLLDDEKKRGWTEEPLYTTPPVPQTEEAQRGAVLQAVAEALGRAYDCQRVWEAWNVGTMGPDDFTLTAEDDDRVAEIADAAIEAIRSFQVPAPQAGEVQS